VSCLVPYEPINCLKDVAPDLWVVDGPEIAMRYAGLRLPFTTRMTVVRLPDGGLWLHSPTAPAPALRAEIARLGPVAYLVSPNRLHTSWIAAWKGHFPSALVAAIAGEKPWDGARLDPAIDLAGTGPFPWSETIAQVLVPGSVFSEAVFFHRRSRSLILTDLIENFELERVTCRWLRALLRLTGPLDPNGTAPLDMRLGFRRHRGALRRAVAQMRVWAPERVLFAHGRWYASDAGSELDRAFRWAG
jgi:hypothetical protein